eukprot:s1257_g2.t1
MVAWIAFPLFSALPMSCCETAGYVGFVNSNFGTASLVLGEEVDFYSWQNTDAAGMEVKIETVEVGNESRGLCVSEPQHEVGVRGEVN